MTAVLMVLGIGLVMGVVLITVGHLFLRAFTQSEPVLEIARNGLEFLAFLYTIMGIGAVMGGAMRGAGAAVAPMVTSLLGLSAVVGILFRFAGK